MSIEKLAIYKVLRLDGSHFSEMESRCSSGVIHSSNVVGLLSDASSSGSNSEGCFESEAEKEPEHSLVTSLLPEPVSL